MGGFEIVHGTGEVAPTLDAIPVPEQHECVPPTHDEIAVAAYYIWQRKAEEWSWMADDADTNWFEAERELENHHHHHDGAED